MRRRVGCRSAESAWWRDDRPVGDEPDKAPWTEREVQVLAALARGSTAREIAKCRGVLVAGVRREVRALRARLGADTTIQAVVAAIRVHVI